MSGSAARVHPRMEQLGDIDDCGPPYPANLQPDSNAGSQSSNNSYRYDVAEDDGGGESGLDDLSHLLTPQKPTPLPKIPLFVLSVVIFSEPLTSTILFPFVYFMNIDTVILAPENTLGNVGVAKSMLGEIADKSNQSQAFSIFGFAWGIGMIIAIFCCE
ncbi:hypothetical protein EDD11_000718 [Mortierella claussenii]|nr:hypothetical protein EDD11_000718 [Mortierella claussenii]